MDFDELAEVIAKDCRTRGVYMSYDGETCAIGGIAKALGVDDDTLISAGSYPIGWVNYSSNTTSQVSAKIIAEIILSNTNLTLNDLVNMQSANDKEYVTTFRARAVLDILDRIRERNETN